MESIEIIITDDKEQLRNTYKEMLEPYSIVTIAEASHGVELLELLKTKTPDVILLDLDMPIMDGNKAFTLIRERFPKQRAIILSNHYCPAIIEDFIERGAKGYIPKDSIMNKHIVLVNAIRQVKDGKIFVHELNNYRKVSFSARQKEIMPLIFENLTNGQIASEVGITKRGIEKQKRKIYTILGATNPMEFYKIAFTQGLQFLGIKKKE